jgi:alcohol dehydrogenase YqhD (iron-dependent ADH family)
MNIEDNMRYAISSAGLKISGRGGIQSQPTKDEVEKYIKLVKVKNITYQ